MSIMRNLLNIIIILCVFLNWGCIEGARKGGSREGCSHTIQVSSLFSSSSSSSSSCLLSSKGEVILANSIQSLMLHLCLDECNMYTSYIIIEHTNCKNEGRIRKQAYSNLLFYVFFLKQILQFFNLLFYIGLKFFNLLFMSIRDLFVNFKFER